MAQNHLIFEEIQLQDASICMEIGNITESVIRKIDSQHRILIWRHNHVRACLTIVKTSLLQLNYQNIVDSVHLENEFLKMKMDKNITICLICKNNTKSS